MSLFIEKCIRGGISYITQRYSNTKIKYVKSTKINFLDFIVYEDANNLHGWPMSQHIHIQDISKRCVLELDLE